MSRPIDPKLHALWADRLQRQPNSGLSITRFCSAEGISPVSFHTWKRRLRFGDSALQPLDNTAAFLPITLRDSRPAAVGSARVEVELPNGVHVRILASDPDFAGRVAQLVATAGRGGPCRAFQGSYASFSTLNPSISARGSTGSAASSPKPSARTRSPVTSFSSSTADVIA